MIWNPDCDENPCLCPGREITEGTRRGEKEPVRVDPAGETFAQALAGAWAWGYAAAQRDALDRPYSDTPEAATWKPTPNPYIVTVECSMHAPVQHRDRKRPWCNACGRSADGEMIGRPRKET